jgi:hypothetical protein
MIDSVELGCWMGTCIPGLILDSAEQFFAAGYVNTGLCGFRDFEDASLYNPDETSSHIGSDFLMLCLPKASRCLGIDGIATTIPAFHA